MARKSTSPRWVSAKKLAKPSQAKSPAKSSQARAFVTSMPLSVSAGALPDVNMPLAPELAIQRQMRMESLKAELLSLIAEGKAESAIDSVLGMMSTLEESNEDLAWRAIRAERLHFGRNTQKLSRKALGQLFLAFGGDAETEKSATEPPVPSPEEPEQVDDEAPAKSEDAEVDGADDEASPLKKRRKRVSSMKVTQDVERNVKSSPLSDEELTCTTCGKQMVVFGHVDHERFTYVPPKIVVHVERREKAGCDCCRKDITVAARSEAPSVKRKVDASLLAKLVAEKCALALPLERQRRELRGLGLDIPEKTLASYWAYAIDLLEPIGVCALAEVFAMGVVGADDSHLKTLDKADKRGVFRGHLWCFVGTEGVVSEPERVAYGYTPSWNATEIRTWFAAIDGDIQCDGYAGYSREVEDDDGETLVAVPPERRLGCGMHIRAKFHAALVANDGRAAIPLKHFADLYAIEADCKARGLDAQARAEERRRRSLPVLDALDAWVDDLHPKLLPKSPLRKATTYAINQRAFFRRCFSDGRFEIDNGRVERRIRNFAVGRRNFLFTGSPRGGERLAIAYTLVDNCTILGIDPFVYLVDVINKLEAGWPLRRLSELVPWRWTPGNEA